MGAILQCKLATHNKIAMCQFVPNFLCYVSVKYYLN